jgi:endonuclease/exonuclease/phosphatase family metal-dependent hydrolase
MHVFNRPRSRRASLALISAVLGLPLAAYGQQIRVATYNIEDDINGATTPLPGMNTVLEGIGELNAVANPHPLDILALEETTSNTQSVAPIVADLNGDYAGANYTMSSFQATESGGDVADGNGPNAIVYNANALNLLASVGVGTPLGSSNGEYRQVVRYEFQPVGGTAVQDFYVYVCHAKSGTGTTNANDRAEEAAIIRANSATLPAGSTIIYTGDWNGDGSTDQSMMDISAAGSAQGVDLLNQTNAAENWATNSTYKGILTESATDLRYRDDIQFVTPNVLSGTGALSYIANSNVALGNNGSTPVYGNVSSGNTALANFTSPSQSAVLNALTTASDHLPVVADYSIVANPDQATWNLSTGGAWGTGGNWVSSILPQFQGQTVNFTAPLSSSSTVTLSANWTVGNVNFASSNANSYTIAPGTSGQLILDNGANSANITNSGGTHFISAPLVLNSNLVVNVVNAGSTLQISGPISGAGAVTIAGNGIVQFAAASTTLPGLTVNSGATLDITNDVVQINFTPGADPAAAIRADLVSGYQSGTWTGTGINSSSAAANPGLFAVGYADGNTDTGTPAAANQILLMKTLAGDATLDGIVNFPDLLVVAQNYGKTGMDWSQGDFNYDGIVNFPDLLLVAQNYGKQLSTSQLAELPTSFAAQWQLAESEIHDANVPEPAGTSLLVIGAGAFLTRRRRASVR